MNWIKKTLRFGEKIKILLKKRPTKEEVENSIGEQISLPSRLKKIMTKKKNTIEIESYDQLKDHLLRRVN